MSSGRPAGVLISVAFAMCLSACATIASAAGGRVEPGHTVEQTIRRAIAMLERYECEAFAVDFLSPIKRSQIKDLDAYRRQHRCSPDDRGNLDEVMLALRLSLGAKPEIHGIKATIDLSGIGLAVSQLEFVKYTDGRWYFNGL